jgi:hypothetical protein
VKEIEGRKVFKSLGERAKENKEVGDVALKSGGGRVFKSFRANNNRECGKEHEKTTLNPKP